MGSIRYAAYGGQAMEHSLVYAFTHAPRDARGLLKGPSDASPSVASHSCSVFRASHKRWSFPPSTGFPSNLALDDALRVCQSQALHPSIHYATSFPSKLSFAHNVAVPVTARSISSVHAKRRCRNRRAGITARKREDIRRSNFSDLTPLSTVRLRGRTSMERWKVQISCCGLWYGCVLA